MANEHVTRAITYIEQNLHGHVDLEEAARAAYVSLMQLYRDFYSLTGHSLKEYIRKRRLSNACAMLRNTTAPLVEVALANGYETQQAFHKHFRKVVGITPMEYRQGHIYFSFSPVDVDTTNPPIKVATITLPSAISCGYVDAQREGIEERAVNQLLALVTEAGAGLSRAGLRFFGRDSKPCLGGLTYELLIAPASGQDAWLAALQKSAFTAIGWVPATTGVYATCTVANNPSTIRDAWNYLFNTWLNTSIFTLAQAQPLEEYLGSRGNPEKLCLYLPVIKKPQVQTVVVENLPSMSFIVCAKDGPEAEREASEAVLHWLQNHHPEILVAAKHFYLAHSKNGYICGIQLPLGVAIVRPPEIGPIRLLHYPAGRYARLTDDCYSDIHIHSAHLLEWCKQHAIGSVQQNPFAVYEMSGEEVHPTDIRMSVYVPLVDDTDVING